MGAKVGAADSETQTMMNTLIPDSRGTDNAQEMG